MIVNPGSEISAMSGEGWTNTVEKARAEARRWLEQMHKSGISEVMLLPGEELHENRWLFRFVHTVTGTQVTLETHGIDDVRAYEREHIFTPSVYWRGSSCSSPRIEDFAAPGFRIHQTFIDELERRL
jgi:hypothetical protein